jgi:hypothetical protein
MFHLLHSQFPYCLLMLHALFHLLSSSFLLACNQNSNKPGSYRRRLSLFAPRPNSPRVGRAAEGVDSERACEL